MDCSYGFRPNRSAHDAIRDLRRELTGMGGGWVLEVDIKSFFDELDHGHLRSFLDSGWCLFGGHRGGVVGALGPSARDLHLPRLHSLLGEGAQARLLGAKAQDGCESTHPVDGSGAHVVSPLAARARGLAAAAAVASAAGALCLLRHHGQLSRARQFPPAGHASMANVARSAVAEKVDAVGAVLGGWAVPGLAPKSRAPGSGDDATEARAAKTRRQKSRVRNRDRPRRPEPPGTPHGGSPVGFDESQGIAASAASRPAARPLMAEMCLS